MGRVVIGMDPHKRSATIEVIDGRERVLAQGRYGTDTGGYQTMLAAGRRFPDRVWAVEGCNGIGRHVAQRLVADGETVLDVPAKLSARVRVFSTGQGRKTDPVDAHSVAVVALRTSDLRQVVVDDTTVALRLLVDGRDQLGRGRGADGRCAADRSLCLRLARRAVIFGCSPRSPGRWVCSHRQFKESPI